MRRDRDAPPHHRSTPPLRPATLFREQAGDLDAKRREATLHGIQQLVHEKVIFAPIWQNAGLNGVGPRVDEAGFGLIAGYMFTAPYEDLKLKAK